MSITDTELLLLTGYSVLLGIALALCYVFFSFSRLLVSPIDPCSAKGRALCDGIYFITDVLYSLFAGICVSLMFFGLNHGRVRLFGLLGCGIGFCLCHFTFGRWLIRLFSRCVAAVRRGIRIVYDHSAGVLFRWIFRAVKAVFSPILRAFKNRKKIKKTKRKGKDEKLEFLG